MATINSYIVTFLEDCYYTLNQSLYNKIEDLPTMYNYFDFVRVTNELISPEYFAPEVDMDVVYKMYHNILVTFGL
jgi:hypothetical protein